MQVITKKIGIFRWICVLGLAVSLFMPLTTTLAKQASSTATSSGTSDLTIYITGLRSNQGVVRASLYNSPDGYATQTPAGAFHTAALPIRGDTAVWRLKNVPTGDYAVLFFHDEDNSGVMNKNLLGIPKEGYGYSGNSGSKTHVPSWDVAKFHVDAQHKTASMTMLYW